MKVIVRTLNSQSHEFDIANDEITVKEFKELIEPKVVIGVATQRLIFKGKVLQDEKKLKEYDVDGCVVHLVERAPPSVRGNQSTGHATPTTSAAVGGSNPSVYVGSLGPMSSDLTGMAQHLVDGLISRFGAGNVSTTQLGTSLNVNVNLRAHNDTRNIQTRLGTARRFLSHAEHLMQHIVEPASSGTSPCAADSQNTTAENSTSETATSNTPQPAEANQNNQQTDEVGPAALGSIYGQVMHLYNHLIPYLQRYENILQRPPQQSEKQPMDDSLPDLMAEIFHDLGHAFHALSDLSMNNTLSPPSLMCFPQISSISVPVVNLQTSSSSSASTGRVSSQSTVSVPPTVQGSTTPGVPRGPASEFVTGIPGFASVPGQAGQGPPVAVGSIATVVQVPATSSVSGPTTQTNQTSTTNTANTFLSGASSNNMLPPGFQPFPFPGSAFNGNVHTSVQVGVFQGTPEMFSVNGSMPAAVHVNIGGGTGSEIPNDVSAEMQRYFEGMFRNSSQQPGVASPTTMTVPASSNSSSTGVSSAPAPMNTTHGHHHQPSHNRRAHHPRSHHPGAQQQRNRNTQHRPHPHHHHHNEDGSVIHPDSLLPCQSFHFGPTFHQPGSHGTEAIDEVVPGLSFSGVLPTGSSVSSVGSASQPLTSQSPSMTTAGGSIPDISNLINGIFGSMASNIGSIMSTGVSASDAMDIDNQSPPVSSSVVQGVQQMFQTFMGVPPTTTTSQQQQEQGPDATRQSLNAFIRQNFGLVESGNDDLLSDFVEVLADNLSMADLVSVLVGTSFEPWNRLQEPLRRLLERRFNNNVAMTTSTIPGIAEKIATDLSSTHGGVEEHLTVNADVDLKATLQKLDQKFIEQFLNLLLSENDSTFGNSLHDCYVEYATWACSVLDYSVDGGADRYMSLLFDLPSVRSLFESMSTPLAFRAMTLDTLNTRIRNTVAGRSITSAQLHSVLVKRSAKVTNTRINPFNDSKDSSSAKRAKKNERVEVDELWEENNPTGSNPSTECSDQEDNPPSPEDWHSRVPSDWVTIISRDVERQRRLPPQRPYSDAYINGLPPKRRKLMTRHSAASDRIDVKESIKLSIARTDVKAQPDEERLQKDIDESELQAMFETTFRHDVQQRLKEDEDYRPKQHRNTEEYFMKEQKSKR